VEGAERKREAKSAEAGVSSTGFRHRQRQEPEPPGEAQTPDPWRDPPIPFETRRNPGSSVHAPSRPGSSVTKSVEAVFVV
jgi:hypothetical protein